MLPKQLSGQVRDVLLKHPHWAHRVQSAITKPPFKLGYSASVVEMFDSYGLLGGIAGVKSMKQKELKDNQLSLWLGIWTGSLGCFMWVMKLLLIA